MDQGKKIDAIQKLNEADLREKVLIPLFTKMGFIDPILHHGSNEKGKDIILKELDAKFNKFAYIAVVVKAGNISGSSSSNSSYFSLVNQIKQSLNESYKHIYELKDVSIDQVIVVISGNFLPASLESIYGTLKSERLDRAIRDAIDITKLVNLVDDFFSEYWNEHENETKSLIEQRNFLLNNLGKLSKVLLPNFKDQESFLQAVSKSEYDIELFPFSSVKKYIANIGYKKLEIDELDDFFADQGISNGYADIKQYSFELKKRAKDILFNIDEVVDILKAILDEKNPDKIVELTFKLGEYADRGYSSDFRFSANDLPRQEDFYFGLKEYRMKKEHLIETGYLEFYNSIWQTIKEKTEKELIDFFNMPMKDEENSWLGFLLVFDLERKQLNQLEYYRFNDALRTTKDLRFDYSTKETERISRGISEIRVEIAINNFGFFKEKELTAQARAKATTWCKSPLFPTARRATNPFP